MVEKESKTNSNSPQISCLESALARATGVINGSLVVVPMTMLG